MYLWLWLAGIGLAFGTGPDLGLGDPAPAGWASDAGLAADVDSVLAPLVSPTSLLGAALFAAAAVALGWVLAARHPRSPCSERCSGPPALNAALAARAATVRSRSPAILVLAGAAAVAIEFRVPRRGGRGGSGAARKPGTVPIRRSHLGFGASQRP